MAKAKPHEPSTDVAPLLFTEEQMPTIPAMVTAAQAYAHTGKTTCKDEERAQAIVQAYLSTGSFLAVARRFAISPNTIKAVLVVFEREGKLDEQKQRVSQKLGTVIELATDRMVEKLVADQIPPNVLPVVLGVSVEKKALIDGEATSRTEAIERRPVQLGDLAAYLHTQGVATPAIDVQSTVLPADPEGTDPKP